MTRPPSLMPFLFSRYFRAQCILGSTFDLAAGRGTWTLWPSLPARGWQTANAARVREPASHPFRNGSSAFGRTSYARVLSR